MDATWTLPELVAEAAARIAALPAPRNGQVRAIPDERTIRYYAAIGLLDRPSALRGRTALYGAKHVAQVVAIKRLQTMGRSLAEIQQLWPTLDDGTLARMSGVALATAPSSPGRAGFWKQEPDHSVDVHPEPAASRGAGTALSDPALPMNHAQLAGEPSTAGLARRETGEPRAVTPTAEPGAARAAGADAARGRARPDLAGAVELRVELAPGVVLSLSQIAETATVALADVRAIRAAAAPLLAELVSRRLASLAAGDGS